MTDTPKLCIDHGKISAISQRALELHAAALEQCEFLYVGITQVERDAMKEFEAAPHRLQIRV